MKPTSDDALDLEQPSFAHFDEQLRAGQQTFTLTEIAALLSLSPEALQGELAALAIASNAADAYTLDNLFALTYRLDNLPARQLRAYAFQHMLAKTPPATQPLPDGLDDGSLSSARQGFVQSIAQWLLAWVDIAYFAVLMLVLALSPSAYRKENVHLLLRLIYSNVWQVLPWFMVLCSLFSLVLIQIVVVSAASYGLSQYALEMVVRVLVLELIPLGTALFVIFGTSANSAISTNSPAFITQTTFPTRSGRASEAIALTDVPSVVAQSFAVVTMAALSSALALFIAYLLVYGFSPWGLEHYTRMVGRVFNLPVSIIFALKIVLFSLAVALVPLACARQRSSSSSPSPRITGGTPQGTIRLFSVLVLIEIASLAIRYI